MSRRFQLSIATTCLCLLVSAAAQNLDKWSRQLEATGPGQADSFDWVPLAQPVDGSAATTKDRSANARVLTYSQTFPPNARFGNLPKAAHNNAPSAQPQSFDFPYQFQRFPNAPQAHSLRQHTVKSSGNIQSQEPTSQSFFKFEMPFHGDSNRPASAPGSLQTGYQIQHTFGGGAQAALFNSALFNQNPVFPPEFHPIPQKPQQQSLQSKPLHQQNYIEDTFPVKNSFRDSKPQQQAQEALQTVTPQVFPVDPQSDQIYEFNKPSSFQAQSPYHHTAPSAAPTAAVPSAPSVSGGAAPEEVQLLYVPYDTLYNQQRPQGPPPTQNPSFEVNKYNFNPGLPAVNPYQINQFYTQDPLAPQDPSYYTTSTTNRPLTTTTNKPAAVFQNFASQQFSTPKPKPKAHQPPLAMFLIRNSARPTQSDVVSALRNSNTISVLDAPTKKTPEIFVGPAGMPIPSGYVKFDLPYLSQLSQIRDLRDVSFFVAPLSYRTPNGFNKILLPEPHVGSIVINRAKDDSEQALPQQPQKNAVFITPESNDFNQFPSTTQRTRPNTQHRYKQHQQPTSPNDYYPDVLRETGHKNRNHYEATTQRTTSQQPSRGNKFNYFYDQDVIQEVTSPKISKHERPKKKRPQNVQIEQPAFTQNIKNPYAQFQPIPNQISNDDYYKLQTTRPTTTSTSTTSTSTSTTSSTSPAPTFYSFNSSPQVEFQSTNGQLYHDFTTAPKAPEEYIPRFTTRPPPVTTAEEEYEMKQYFRQQNAIRNRPHSVATTNSPFEQVQYTPVSLDYDRPANSPATTQKSTTHKQRVTFYTPTPAPTTATEEQPINTIPPRTQAVEYNTEQVSYTESSTEKIIPNNHRHQYNQNEILDGTVEYEPNPYQLPSELPPLTPNLPGLVNNLQEKDKQNAFEQTSAATPAYEEPTRPTRRPINRIRKPVVAKVSSSVSYSESETSSKRPSHRIRRPYGTKGSSVTTVSSDSYTGDDESTSTTTRRPLASRNPLIRNPNRIRYQPTPEERQTLRIKPKKKYNGSNKVTASEDLDYQRDVLKQNYPVFRQSGSSSSSSSSSTSTLSRRPTSPTAIPSSYSSSIFTTDRPTSESQQVYTVTPSNTVENSDQVFPGGLLEPMQIAQQYNDYSKDNYGPGYFPNQEDLNPTEPVLKNEISPVYTTLPTAVPKTTTTEEPLVITTRRSPFIRRNYPRLRSTTTEAPTTTTTAAEERQTARSRIPPRKVIKVRTRTRRPQHPASSTTAPEDEVEQEQEVKANYRKLSRFNQDLYENDTPRRRYKQQFHLDGQESQWSPAVKSANKNSFSPIDTKAERQENKHSFDNEPEIVTAGPEQNEKNADTYEVNVSANLGSTGSETKVNMKQPNLKPEKSFAELLEEVMGKAPEEHTTESDLSTRTTDSTYFESQKTSISNRLNRRGKWKKLKTTAVGANNGESFETAESQNIGAQLLNSLREGGEKIKTNVEYESDLSATTPLSATTIATIKELTTLLPATTTPTPQTTMDEYDMTTARVFESTTIPTTLPMDEMLDNLKTTTVSLPETTAEENATSRLGEDDLASEDDLETQPSLFSEVKRQLHELFAVEESDDEAATAALAAVGRRRQEYTNIKRVKPEPTTVAPQNVETATEVADESGIKKPFHKNLMDHVVYATERSTKISSETEICYRGRCIRSEDLPPNHKLN